LRRDGNGYSVFGALGVAVIRDNQAEDQGRTAE
jgi:hypothetical protein